MVDLSEGMPAWLRGLRLGIRARPRPSHGYKYKGLIRSISFKGQHYTVKKVSIFLSPAGMSLTKLLNAGNILIIPGRRDFMLVTSRLWTGK
jgi:hypothetical protein